MFQLLKKKTPPVGETIILKIDGMHCMSCSMNIDGALEDTPGVIEADTNYAKGESKVIFDPEQVTTKKMSQVIEKLGYRVTNSL